ncbi:MULTISPECIES: hypothetical protein [unclassified Streptomyces]|uniref:hypothetical protein n=1 Tax=unclassified Streptomyces TaxID=2593676 RepID=UPI00017E8B44|nr:MULTISPECIES: hypothetical protein [unclassified Streptomyces]EDX21213.1 conserved hypothetical protein [Streptomyces sp. Mg1]RPK44735.1 hypothetical protein EES37_16360 [Streptomyces sp. ADI91-18]
MKSRSRATGLRRFDRGTLRAAGFVALLTVVFLVTNTAVAAAADGTADGGSGLLAPLNVRTAEGGLLEGYQLESRPAAYRPEPAMPDVVGQAQVMMMSGLFTLARLLVGLCCWLIGFVFRFPLLTLLTGPAQHLADSYQAHIVDALGLKGLMLAWAFVFGLILFARGKVGTGLGQIGATLVIAALAASVLIRPDYLLGRGGPLDQTHKAAIEVASITTSSYFGTKTSSDPCDLIHGPAQSTCESSGMWAQAVVKPIQDSLTDALVVKPYMLLQYGRILDPKTDKAAYEAHLKWIKSGEPVEEEPERENPCELLDRVSREYCESSTAPRRADFNNVLKDLDKAGPAGKAAASYAKEPSWDRVFAALALLIAVAVVTAMVVSMSLVMLGAQGADAAAAGAGPVVWVLAMLPGPTRTLLWRWAGVFVTSALVTFATAMAIPLFGIAANVLLSDSGPDLMVERLLLLDALAIAFLVMHKRVAAAATSVGQRMAIRMRYANLGGSGFPRGLAMGMAGGGGRGGAPFSLGRAAFEARTAARMGTAPFALALRGAHAALIGPKPANRHPVARALTAALRDAGIGGGQPRPKGQMQVDKWTGEVLHDPATDRPLLGSRFHKHASRLRGYRIAHRAGRTAYGATIGLPRTVHTAKRKASEFTDDARTQLRVAANYVGDDAYAWKGVGRAVGRSAVNTGRLARDTAISAAIYTAPTAGGRTPGPHGISHPDNPAAATSGTRRPGAHAVSRPVVRTANGNGNGSRIGTPGAGSQGATPGSGSEAPSRSIRSGAASGSGYLPSSPRSPASDPAAGQAAADRARLIAVMRARRQAARDDQGNGGTQ